MYEKADASLLLVDALSSIRAAIIHAISAYYLRHQLLIGSMSMSAIGDALIDDRNHAFVFVLLGKVNFTDDDNVAKILFMQNNNIKQQS